MKKIWMTIWGIIFAITLGLTGTVAAAQEETMENHFVIMLDTSGSMDKIDSEKQAGDIIMRFLNKMPLKTYPAKISIILFDTEPRDCLVEDGNPWCYINDGGKSDQRIKDALSGIAYNGERTDIRKAMAHCKDVLQQMRDGVSASRQTVLFITDGFLDVSGDEQNSNLDKTYASYQEMITLSEEFPADCCFLGIMPEAESVPKSVAVFSEDAEGNQIVVNYSSTPVEGEMQYKLMEVVEGLEEFCDELNKRHPLDQVYRSEAEKINLSGEEGNPLNLIDEKYEEFFKSLFSTETKEYEKVNLNDGVDVTVPKFVGEVNIAIVPDGDSLEERRQKIMQLIGEAGLQILRDNNMAVDFILSYSDTSVNVKIVNPESGVYTLSSPQEIAGSVSLKFTSYGELELQCDDVSSENVLGDVLQIKGQVVDSKGEAIPESDMQNVKLWIKETDSDNRIEVTQIEGNTFYAEYLLNRVGSYYITMELEYSDWDTEEEPAGITKFWSLSDPIHIEVPEVEYRFADFPEKSISYATVHFALRPFSNIDGNFLEVRAEDCEHFLGDKWLVRINGEEEGEAAADSLEAAFCFDKKFIYTGKYTVEFYNERTGQTLDTEISVENIPLQIVLPEEEILGNEIEITVKHPQEVSEAGQCEITVADENQEICKKEILSFSEGTAVTHFKAETCGTYYVTAKIDGMEPANGEIKVVNHGPEKTADMPECLILPCMLYKKCETEVDMGTWFADPDLHSWSVQFSEDDYFKMDNKKILSEKGTGVLISRDTVGFHLPKTSVLSYTTVDEYGMAGVSGTLQIKEKVPMWVKLILAAPVLVISIVILLCRRVYKLERINIVIYDGDRHFQAWLLRKEGEKKTIRRRGKKLLILLYENNKVWYVYKDEKRMANDTTIYLI